MLFRCFFMKEICSIKETKTFLYLYKNAKFYVGKFMVLYVLPNDLQSHRLGVVVGKKVGNSVKRSRVKRLIKENFRNCKDELKDWHDFVFIARKTEDLPQYSQIKKEMKYLMKKLDVLD